MNRYLKAKKFHRSDPFPGEKILNALLSFLNKGKDTMYSHPPVFLANKPNDIEGNRAHSSQSCQVSIRILWLEQTTDLQIGFVNCPKKCSLLHLGSLYSWSSVTSPILGSVLEFPSYFNTFPEELFRTHPDNRESTLSLLAIVSRHSGTCLLQQARPCACQLNDMPGSSL